MIKEKLLFKYYSYCTNGTFVFAMTHKISRSAKSKEPFFSTLPENVL
jgi:hypothetical protein